MKASLKNQIRRLLNKSEDKTLLWFDGQYFELIKGEMKSITEASALMLVSNPDCHIMTFRIDRRKFSSDTWRWEGPEIQELPEIFKDKRNIHNFIVSDPETVNEILKLRKEFAK